MAKVANKTESKAPAQEGEHIPKLQESLTSIVEYSETAQALAVLNEKYKGVLFDVKSKEGMSAAVKARAELRGYRVSLEKTRKDLKVDILKRSREIDSEAKRITEELESLEIPIDDQIKADERRKAKELQDKIDAENARKAAEEKARKEAEERVLAAQRAEIERQQQELAARKREQEEKEAAARRKIEEAEREARERIEEQERIAREKREAAQREIDERAERIRQEQLAEMQRVIAERERVNQERREIEERERRERDAKEEAERAARLAEEERQRKAREEREAIEYEKRRLQQAQMDAHALLVSFRDQYGEMAEFADIIKAINKYLKDFSKKVSADNA